ncbi:MAG: hypothetical protein H6964_09295 [Chromatiaceae bacterium]|nr:hypothetical protein [Chromatiaceae bacterium]MCP5447177.1 hypothetical protein [Chromatiaceae bacterium]
METEKVGNCWHCGADLGKYDYGREINCSACGKPTRVCRNCRWFDPGRVNQCQEPIADEVKDKVRANFCEYFEATLQVGGDGSAAEKLRQSAEDLFK